MFLLFSLPTMATASAAAIATVPVGAKPGSVGVDPQDDRIYSANDLDNTVSVIDGMTNSSGGIYTRELMVSTPPTCGDFVPAPTSPEPVGNGPFVVVVGDFNLDGQLDLATSNLTASTVTILLGDGTGNFNPAPSSPEAVGARPGLGRDRRL